MPSDQVHPLTCEACKGPLDPYAQENECAYCSKCTDPTDSVFGVLNYLRVPVQAEPMRDADGNEIPWPDPKDPALWHDKACKMFPSWGRVVALFRRSRKVKHFDLDALRDLIEYVRESGEEKTLEEVMITKLDAVADRLEAEATAAALRKYAEDNVLVEPLPLGHATEESVEISTVSHL